MSSSVMPLLVITPDACLHPSMRRTVAPGTKILLVFSGARGESRFGAGRIAAVEFAAEPGAGEDPVTVGGAGGHAQDGRHLVASQAGKEAQFDELRFLRVALRQPAQGGVEGQQVLIGFRG